jgi:hypothetical protein
MDRSDRADNFAGSGGGISVRDLGEVPDAPVFRTRIDWYVGFGVMHPRSAGRLHSIAPIT